MKPRHPGTLHAAVTTATGELGLTQAADLIGRSESWVYSAGDPDRDPGKAANLSYQDARTWTRNGAHALAEDLCLLAGGSFLPPAPSAAPLALQEALARFSTESGEAVSEIVRSVMDGALDADEARRAVKEIDDALRPLMALRAMAMARLEQG